MLVAMTKIHILGRRADAERVLAALHRLQAVEIADTDANLGLTPLPGHQARVGERDALQQTLAQTAALLAELPPAAATSTVATSVDVRDLAEEVRRFRRSWTASTSDWTGCVARNSSSGATFVRFDG